MSSVPASGAAAPLVASRWRGDLIAGLTVAVVMVAIDGAYGLVTFAALGPSATSVAFTAGIVTAVLANLLTPALGARGPLLCGSASALALLAHPLITAAMAVPALQNADGSPRVAAIMAVVAAGVVLGGLLQTVLALLRAGRLVRYVPYPVHAGFMNGVAVLMLVAMLPHILGSGTMVLSEARPAATVIAVLCAVIAVGAGRYVRKVPPVLLALATGTLLHHGVAATLGPQHVGPLLGRLQVQPPTLDTLRDAAALFEQGALLSLAWPLAAFAVALALLSTLQTLLAGSVVDTVVQRRHDPDREVLAQGVVNVLTGPIGGIGSAGGLARSMVGLNSGGTGAATRLAYGAGLVLLLVAMVPVLAQVSMAALAGVFVATGYGMVDAWSRTATRQVLGGVLRGRLPGRALWQSYAVMVAVAGIAVFASIGVAVLVGILIGMVMFIARHSRDPVRHVSRAAQRSSRRIRTPAQVEALRTHGDAIVVIELQGPLFFGTADAASRGIERHAASAQQVIVDFRRVTDVDVSGARVLLQAGVALAAAGRRLLVSGLVEGDAGLRAIREVDVRGALADMERHDDVDLALEAAEDRLLAQLGAVPPPAQRLPLADTMLGAGMTPEQVQVLAGCLGERVLARGETVFRQGEPGDAMFVSVQGRIAIWARGTGHAERRLVSFAPGVVFGEMAMLSGAPRSADGVAEEDAVVLELSRATFERLQVEHPALAGQLLRNVSLHLAARLRTVTEELQAAQT